ncbi:hypothetical protein TWF696_004602 [Orbilia brochopaga]|uniref:LysM domain-containing protein n=1 Tax=Orbilia brochopaga TaxID=3140254 RepID=A0AAV9V9E9_9PEZI
MRSLIILHLSIQCLLGGIARANLVTRAGGVVVKQCPDNKPVLSTSCVNALIGPDASNLEGKRICDALCHRMPDNAASYVDIPITPGDGGAITSLDYSQLMQGCGTHQNIVDAFVQGCGCYAGNEKCIINLAAPPTTTSMNVPPTSAVTSVQSSIAQSDIPATDSNAQSTSTSETPNAYSSKAPSGYSSNAPDTSAATATSTSHMTSNTPRPNVSSFVNYQPPATSTSSTMQQPPMYADSSMTTSSVPSYTSMTSVTAPSYTPLPSEQCAVKECAGNRGSWPPGNCLALDGPPIDQTYAPQNYCAALCQNQLYEYRYANTWANVPQNVYDSWLSTCYNSHNKVVEAFTRGCACINENLGPGKANACTIPPMPPVYSSTTMSQSMTSASQTTMPSSTAAPSTTQSHSMYSPMSMESSAASTPPVPSYPDLSSASYTTQAVSTISPPAAPSYGYGNTPSNSSSVSVPSENTPSAYVSSMSSMSMTYPTSTGSPPAYGYTNSSTPTPTAPMSPPTSSTVPGACNIKKCENRTSQPQWPTNCFQWYARSLDSTRTWCKNICTPGYQDSPSYRNMLQYSPDILGRCGGSYTKYIEAVAEGCGCFLDEEVANTCVLYKTPVVSKPAGHSTPATQPSMYTSLPEWSTTMDTPSSTTSMMHVTGTAPSEPCVSKCPDMYGGRKGWPEGNCLEQVFNTPNALKPGNVIDAICNQQCGPSPDKRWPMAYIQQYQMAMQKCGTVEDLQKALAAGCGCFNDGWVDKCVINCQPPNVYSYTTQIMVPVTEYGTVRTTALPATVINDTAAGTPVTLYESVLVTATDTAMDSATPSTKTETETSMWNEPSASSTEMPHSWPSSMPNYGAPSTMSTIAYVPSHSAVCTCGNQIPSCTVPPGPVQTGSHNPMCNQWYKVVPGDTCDMIAWHFKDQAITSDDIMRWNEAARPRCESILAGYWICVGILHDNEQIYMPTATQLPGYGYTGKVPPAMPSDTSTSAMSSMTTTPPVMYYDSTMSMSSSSTSTTMTSIPVPQYKSQYEPAPSSSTPPAPEYAYQPAPSSSTMTPEMTPVGVYTSTQTPASSPPAGAPGSYKFF